MIQFSVLASFRSRKRRISRNALVLLTFLVTAYCGAMTMCRDIVSLYHHYVALMCIFHTQLCTAVSTVKILRYAQNDKTGVIVAEPVYE